MFFIDVKLGKPRFISRALCSYVWLLAKIAARKEQEDKEFGILGRRGSPILGRERRFVD